MKVLFLSQSDWANLAYNFSKSLRSIGGYSNSYCLNSHPFGYKEQSIATSLAHIRKLILEYDCIIYAHGDISLLNITKDLLINKKVGVCYTGTAYRNNPEAHNREFNPLVNFSLTDHTEFHNLGAKKLNYIAPPIETNIIPKFGHELKKPYKIGHFPSNSEVKGTKKIIELLQKCQQNFEFLHSIDIVNHELQYKRMNNCDIYIELFKNSLNGKEYGCWGVTAFEAAAAGKIVVTQNLYLEVYKKIYGYCPIVITNTEQDFIDNINVLTSLSPLQLSQLQTHTFEWVKENHSFETTGNRLLKLLQ